MAATERVRSVKKREGGIKGGSACPLFIGGRQEKKGGGVIFGLLTGSRGRLQFLSEKLCPLMRSTATSKGGGGGKAFFKESLLLANGGHLYP